MGGGDYGLDGGFWSSTAGPFGPPGIGRTAETEIVYDRSRTRRHKACSSFAQRPPSPGRRPGVAKCYIYVCKCHYIEGQPPLRPAYIHADRPKTPDRLPRPGLGLVDFARGRAGFSCWRFTGEQLHLLLLNALRTIFFSV